MIAERIPVRQFSPLLLHLLVFSKKELEAPCSLARDPGGAGAGAGDIGLVI